MSTKSNGEIDFGDLIQVVSMDVMDALKIADDSKTPQSYRTLIRTVFAGAEAIIWYMKRLTLQVTKREPTLYSSFEAAALKDEAYTVANNGKVAVRQNFLTLTISIKLVLRLLARNQSSNADLEIHPISMAVLEEALQVRHRLTHPKNAADMNVTKKDFKRAVESWVTVLTFGLNAALEADKRLGTGMFPLKSGGTLVVTGVDAAATKAIDDSEAASSSAHGGA